MTRRQLLDAAVGLVTKVVLIVMFLMVILNVDHPPAAGFAVGLVIEHWDLWTVTVMLSDTIVLMGLKKLFEKQTINLISDLRKIL